jgi:putative molybdopterin biosynthesis protein
MNDLGSMDDLDSAIAGLARQDQFLSVVTPDEARARFFGRLELRPLGDEPIGLDEALDRVLAEDVVAAIDVPGFDRANVDGFAVRAIDTFGASPRTPTFLALNREILTPGVEPRLPVEPGKATLIATGGMLPRGADCVVMIEHTGIRSGSQPQGILIHRPATTGQFVAFAGSDISRGETLLRRGQRLSSREIGMLAALGRAEVNVVRRPKVAIISTGNEVVAPGLALRPGEIYDSNAAILAAATLEAGGLAHRLGIGSDDSIELTRLVERGLASCDLVVLSGGTSKGAGDLCHRVVAAFTDPGILVHGVALKPGKPVCLALTRGKPVIILPGFPTSAIFTFHTFVAPIIRAYAGRAADDRPQIPAVLPFPVASERGRTEFLMVSLARGSGDGLLAYPIAKGSGAVTSFGQADGFIAIDQQIETLAALTPVTVQLIGPHRAADLVMIGSHCVGLDLIAGRLAALGLAVKILNVGSTGGLAAAKRGECDIAPVHLMDPSTGLYNRPFLTAGLELVAGYRRRQGIIYRQGDPRFAGRAWPDILGAAVSDDCLMVNRNAGSGTRILTDRLLNGTQPPGYWSQPRSHNAVAVAIAQGRADWGVAIESVARQYELGFLAVQDEHYDFVVPKARFDLPAVRQFRALIADPSVQDALAALGFRFVVDTC